MGWHFGILDRRCPMATITSAMAALLLSGAGPSGRYFCNGESCSVTASFTVLDTFTGLMWQREIAWGGNATVCTSDLSLSCYTWDQAMSYCESSTLEGHS